MKGCCSPAHCEIAVTATDLQKLREEIDAIDEKLLRLISRRVEIAMEVAATKQASGETASFYRPEREAQVLRRIKQLNQGPLTEEEVARLFREIMSTCLAKEKPLNVAFLGPEGTFTQTAAIKHFGHAVLTVPQPTIDVVFREVESGSADFGVVPIENSTEGVIHHTIDMFVDSSLKICGEVELRIHHHLLGTKPSLNVVKRVYSHQQSLGQCRKWLETHLSGVETIAVSSNAEAARLALNEDGAAAIAGTTAAEIYGLQTIVPNIEDRPDNTTRFLVIGKLKAESTGTDKTSIIMSTRNRPGALFKLLSPLAQNGVSMTRIESRPSRTGLWEYVFFLDIEGHMDDANVVKALDEMSAEASFLKLLGSYPRAVL